MKQLYLLFKRQLQVSVILLGLLGMVEYAAAQADIDDTYQSYNQNVQTWFGVKINRDFKKGFSLSGQYLLRVNATNRAIGGHYFSTSLKYKINKYLIADFKFRGANTPFANKYRFEIGLKARYKKKDWAMYYRMGYFHEIEYYARRYQRGHGPVNYWRHQIGVNWDFKKHWSAFSSVEANLLLNNRGVFLRRIAGIVGVDYTIKKNHTVSLFYRAQPSFNKKNLDAIHALGLTYTWDIPTKLFKKKKKKQNG